MLGWYVVMIIDGTAFCLFTSTCTLDLDMMLWLCKLRLVLGLSFGIISSAGSQSVPDRGSWQGFDTLVGQIPRHSSRGRTQRDLIVVVYSRWRVSPARWADERFGLFITAWARIGNGSGGSQSCCVRHAASRQGCGHIRAAGFTLGKTGTGAPDLGS